MPPGLPASSRESSPKSSAESLEPGSLSSSYVNSENDYTSEEEPDVEHHETESHSRRKRKGKPDDSGKGIDGSSSRHQREGETSNGSASQVHGPGTKKRKVQSGRKEKTAGVLDHNNNRKRVREETAITVSAPQLKKLSDFDIDDEGNPILPRNHGYRIGPPNGPFTYEALKGKIQWKGSKELIQKAMVKFNYYGRSDEVTDKLCMSHLYKYFSCNDQEGDDEVQEHINALFRNKLLTKVVNDGRVWRNAGFIKQDDPAKGTWRWVGGRKAPPYLQNDASTSKPRLNVDNGSAKLREALREFTGSPLEVIQLVAQELSILHHPSEDISGNAPDKGEESLRQSEPPANAELADKGNEPGA